jgi:hypothetical protein
MEGLETHGGLHQLPVTTISRAISAKLISSQSKRWTAPRPGTKRSKAPSAMSSWTWILDRLRMNGPKVGVGFNRNGATTQRERNEMPFSFQPFSLCPLCLCGEQSPNPVPHLFPSSFHPISPVRAKK